MLSSEISVFHGIIPVLQFILRTELLSPSLLFTTIIQERLEASMMTDRAAITVNLQVIQSKVISLSEIFGVSKRLTRRLMPKTVFQ